VDHFNVNVQRSSDSPYLSISSYLADLRPSKCREKQQEWSATLFNFFLQHNKLLTYFPNTNCNACVLYQDSDTRGRADSRARGKQRSVLCHNT
jgi:hypothetical protein